MENKQTVKSPALAYIAYLFQTFLKRPFGYIVAILFVVYLSVILLIVPAVLDFNPLFIWTLGGFNMTMFNLFFIAGFAASMAVAIFRTGRDDGFDLNMSTKPFTKGMTVMLKTAVYLIIMFIISALTIIIGALVLPVFGEYNIETNPNGITIAKYTGLLLSLFVGNTVNMLFFGGIAVLISMVGKQVIIIIGTVASVFLICLMNFLYPQVLSSSIDILSDRYNTYISSYSCNTVSQHEHPEMDQTPFNFATIHCITDDYGVEENHYDTKEYWDIAEREAGRKAANYIDIGKHLSSLYTIGGLDSLRAEQASRLSIGVNSNFNYTIDASTHISSEQNITEHNYPISYYCMYNSQGKAFPHVLVVGGNMTISTNNWYIQATLQGINHDSIMVISDNGNNIYVEDRYWEEYKTPYVTMAELSTTDEEKDVYLRIYNDALSTYVDLCKRHEEHFNPYYYAFVSINESEEFKQLQTGREQFIFCAKLLLEWSLMFQRNQIAQIQSFADEYEYDDHFPFRSKTILDWQKQYGDFEYEDDFNWNILNVGIPLPPMETETSYNGIVKLVTSGMDYAETFNNLYQYTVSNFYDTGTIIAIWTAISICLFAGAIIVYKKTDFK